MVDSAAHACPHGMLQLSRPSSPWRDAAAASLLSAGTRGVAPLDAQLARMDVSLAARHTGEVVRGMARGRGCRVPISYVGHRTAMRLLCHRILLPWIPAHAYAFGTVLADTHPGARLFLYPAHCCGGSCSCIGRRMALCASPPPINY